VRQDGDVLGKGAQHPGLGGVYAACTTDRSAEN
jgi:hypothetical protein